MTDEKTETNDYYGINPKLIDPNDVITVANVYDWAFRTIYQTMKDQNHDENINGAWEKRKEINRGIGHLLHILGGFPLMYAMHRNLNGHLDGGDLRVLEYDWNNIGPWQA